MISHGAAIAHPAIMKKTILIIGIILISTTAILLGLVWNIFDYAAQTSGKDISEKKFTVISAIRARTPCSRNFPPRILPNYSAQGATWLRRGLQNLWCMPRCGIPRKSIRKLIVANDDNYALAA